MGKVDKQGFPEIVPGDWFLGEDTEFRETSETDTNGKGEEVDDDPE